MAYAYFNEWDFILMVVKPRAEVLKIWYTLKGELLLIFVSKRPRDFCRCIRTHQSTG